MLERKKICKSTFKLTLLYFKEGMLNIFNITLYPLFLRVLLLWIGFRGEEDLLLGLVYSQTFQNIFCTFIMFGTVNVISTEVSKCMSAGSTSKVPKVLQYSLMFGIVYILFVFLPVTLFCSDFLNLITKLPPHVLEITKKTNYLTFVPMVLSCTYLSISTYFQSLGLGAVLGKYNMIFGVVTLGFVVLYINLTDDIYNGYILFTWSVPVLQFFSSIFLYFKALMPDGRICSLGVEWKDLTYIISRILGNVAVEVIECFDTELVVILSSLWLSEAESKAFNFSFQIFFLSIFGVMPFLRLIYCAFSEFLGENRPKIAKKAYMLTSFIYLLTTLLFALPFLMGVPWASKFALKNNLEARKFLPVLLLCCVAGKFARTHLSYTFEVMKGLDLRATSIFILMLKNACFVGSCYYFVKEMNLGSQGLYLGFFGCNFIMDLIYNLILICMNWKKKLAKLRLL